MTVLSCNCVRCGTPMDVDIEDDDPTNLNPVCLDCKILNAPQVQEYAAACPGCEKTLLLGAMQINQVLQGECENEECRTPLKAWLMSYADGSTYAHVEKIYGGPNSAKEDQEPEWKI